MDSQITLMNIHRSKYGLKFVVWHTRLNKNSDMNKKAMIILALLMPVTVLGQQRLTLDECRQMAVASNKDLNQSAIQIKMAGYDRGIARANYFPKISAQAAYLYNNQDISLIGDDASSLLQNSGTMIQGQINGKMSELTQAIMSNPAAAKEFLSSPMWQTVLGALSKTDVSGAINGIGARIDDALHFDITNTYVGSISITQPVFAGGKIIAANRIAALAEELAKDKYQTEYQKIIVDVSQAYWQIVAISAKKELAENYSDLLEKMVHDVELTVSEGVATESDLLTIKVKANEAQTMKLKASNGLTLAKMLLCKEIGLPLDSDIMLADEGCEFVPEPEISPIKPMEEIYGDRPEVKSLDAAAKIYDNKIKVARADMLPTVAVMTNYMVTNPNLNNGFKNDFAGRFSAGVVVKIPIFHGFEANYKTKKAKAEAELYRLKLDDAKEMISLEVSKVSNQQSEAAEYLLLTESNLDSAEENMRHAMVGFAEGVVDANTALAAQTAWLKAHSEFIEAGIALQMSNVEMQRVQGNIK